MNLKEALQAFLDHRRIVLQRRTRHRLAAIARRMEILKGQIIVYLNIDEVIRIIRESDEPKTELMARWDLSELQAEAILNLRLRALRKLEEIEIRKELTALEKEEGELTALLAQDRRQWRAIGKEIAETRKEIEHFCGLGARVVNQSRRRVLDGEQVPTAEKLYSIFEPHTDLIKRGKVQTPIEFGHKVFLAESARGLITQYDVLDGNPVDEQHVVISLERHRQTFGDVPELYGSDRGFFSEKNVMSCKQEGVKVVCIPQRGGIKAPEREAYEKTREFKDGQRFRAGIEGRISVLFRGRGMKRCLAEGRERFELWVAAAVLANNLMKIAALLAERPSRRRKAA